MSKQPEALRHANKLDAHDFDEPHGAAAAELRRLHAQHDALLEALQNLDANPELTSAWLQARAAIKALEEEK